MTSLLRRIIELLAPRACACCGRRLAPEEEVLCAPCNLGLPRTHYADAPYDNEMARTLWARIPVERAAALFFHHSHSDTANILYRLKYNGHPEVGEAMGRMIAREWQPKGFFDGIDLIIPVPLAPSRQRQRGYNQSYEIAKGISHVTHIPINTSVAYRNKFAASNTRLGRWERAENVEGVFELLNPAAIHGKHLLLIDDVVTTGATVTACGTELVQAGDVRISVLSLAFAKG